MNEKIVPVLHRIKKEEVEKIPNRNGENRGVGVFVIENRVYRFRFQEQRLKGRMIFTDFEALNESSDMEKFFRYDITNRYAIGGSYALRSLSKRESGSEGGRCYEVEDVGTNSIRTSAEERARLLQKYDLYFDESFDKKMPAGAELLEYVVTAERYSSVVPIVMALLYGEYVQRDLNYEKKELERTKAELAEAKAELARREELSETI